MTFSLARSYRTYIVASNSEFIPFILWSSSVCAQFEFSNSSSKWTFDLDWALSRSVVYNRFRFRPQENHRLFIFFCLLVLILMNTVCLLCPAAYDSMKYTFRFWIPLLAVHIDRRLLSAMPLTRPLMSLSLPSLTRPLMSLSWPYRSSSPVSICPLESLHWPVPATLD